MSRSRTRPSVVPAPAPASTAPSSPGAEILWVLLAIVSAMIVFRGALPYFFAQDDFSGLARARGLLPAVPFPWRWLSGQLYFEVMRGVAGLDPLPYRIVTLGALAACVALVYRLCRRFCEPAPAAVGAIFFGAHPALFTAIYSVSGIGELLALAFALASLLLVTRPGAAAWFAVPLFAASLLSKESTLLVPLLALLPALRPTAARAAASPARGASRAHTGALRAITPPVWCLLALSLGYALTFLSRDVFGTRDALGDASAYALRFDRTLYDNLLTYLGWSVTIGMPWMTSFTDKVEPEVWVAGGMCALACGAGLGIAGLRRRGWSVGMAWFAACLLPVLPLAHHTYHYYLLAPLAGGALMVAALASLTSGYVARVIPARGANTVLALLGLLLAFNGAAVVRKIETMPFLDPELRSDATVDRARIAANAIGDLRAAAVPPATQLWFWSPTSRERHAAEGRDGAAESYWEANVRSALYDGLAARLFVPHVTHTRFVRAFEPAGDSVRYAVYLPNGHLKLGTSAELDSMLRRMHPGAP